VFHPDRNLRVISGVLAGIAETVGSTHHASFICSMSFAKIPKFVILSSLGMLRPSRIRKNLISAISAATRRTSYFYSMSDGTSLNHLRSLNLVLMTALRTGKGGQIRGIS
jgi:hypothetical protein